MKRRNQRVIEGLIITVILGVVFYVAMPITPSRSERAKVDQMVPPLDYIDEKETLILQYLVDSVELPIEIELCSDLVDRRISIKTDRPMKVREILKMISVATERDLVLFVGIEATIARPRFPCPQFGGSFKLIQKRERVGAGPRFLPFRPNQL